MADLNDTPKTPPLLDALIRQANGNDGLIRRLQEDIPPGLFLQATISELEKPNHRSPLFV